MTQQLPGELSDEIIALTKRALAHIAGTQDLVELAVALALNDGGSVRQLSEATGPSTTTVRKYGHAHGWPSIERREQLSSDRHEWEAFHARLRAGSARLAVIKTPATRSVTYSARSF